MNNIFLKILITIIFFNVNIVSGYYSAGCGCLPDPSSSLFFKLICCKYTLKSEKNGRVYSGFFSANKNSAEKYCNPPNYPEMQGEQADICKINDIVYNDYKFKNSKSQYNSVIDFCKKIPPNFGCKKNKIRAVYSNIP